MMELPETSQKTSPPVVQASIAVTLKVVEAVAVASVQFNTEGVKLTAEGEYTPLQ